MFDQMAPVHGIMKQVIKVTDVWPFILPGLLFNATIRLLCPNLAHQMASFTGCVQYEPKLRSTYNVDLYTGINMNVTMIAVLFKSEQK